MRKTAAFILTYVVILCFVFLINGTMQSIYVRNFFYVTPEIFVLRLIMSFIFTLMVFYKADEE